jgi:membrane protein required for colicin V production
VLPYFAFGAVFALIVIAVNLLGKLISASIDKTFLGSADKVAGAVLGLFRSAFMFSIVLWIVDSLKFKFLTQWTDGSRLYPMVANIAPKFADWISGFFPFFRDVF